MSSTFFQIVLIQLEVRDEVSQVRWSGNPRLCAVTTNFYETLLWRLSLAIFSSIQTTSVARQNKKSRAFSDDVHQATYSAAKPFIMSAISPSQRR